MRYFYLNIGKLIVIFFIIFFNCKCFAFSTSDSTISSNPKQRYLGISGGGGIGKVRDYGTSPLFYSGFLLSVKIEYIKYKSRNIFYYKIGGNTGNYRLKADNRSFITSGNTFELKFSYLRDSELSNDEKLKNYFGTSIENIFNIRNNEAFMNAAVTRDNIGSISINYRLEYRFERKEKKVNIFNIIRYNRKEKEYLLSFDFTLPVYSLIYRPGFNLIGNGTLNEDKIFAGYEFNGKFLSGLNTDIGISRILRNGNMVKISYYWDLFTTGDIAYNELNTTKHLLLFSFVFNFD